MTVETASHAGPASGAAAIPEHVGHYRILRRIDRGGVAQVFVGERADGLFDHRVAIKRVAASLAPTAARDWFETERQALARLSHRNIAQLFDGGVDHDGCPFLIMELVDGLPIDRHVAENDLSVREVVALVAAVCDGVQYAHQQLIIHAGLNPANILVEPAGEPRIVDFGFARALPEAEPGAAFPPLSPDYASPQRLDGALPSIQDDVYALGAIVFELVTGAPPPHTGKAPSASDTLSRRPEAKARARGRACAGDLDHIIARACAPDSAARYASVIDFSDDLRAWLAHRPLSGRRHQTAYVFGKLLRRRRLAAIATSLVVSGLVIAIAVSAALYVSADRDRAQAERRFADVRDLSRYLIYDVNDRLEQTPQALSMRHDVADIAQSYLDKLASTPSAPLAVRRDVAESLIRLAALQSGRARSNLGHPAEAKANLARADAILADMEGSGALAIEDQHRRIEISLLRASIAMNNDQALADAEAFMETARRQLASLPPPGAPPELAVEAAMSSAELASWQGHYPEALARATSALALIAGLPSGLRKTDDIQNFEIRARTIRGDAYYYLEQYRDAEAVYRENVARAALWLKEAPDNMLARRHAIIARWNLGTTIMERDPAGALRELDAASVLLPRLMAFEPADENALRTESVVMLSRAEVLAASGRLPEALEVLEQQDVTRRKRYEASPGTPEYARAYAVFLTAKGGLLADNGRIADACRTYAEADRIFTQLQSRGRVSGFDAAANGGLDQLRQAMKAHCSPDKP